MRSARRPRLSLRALRSLLALPLVGALACSGGGTGDDTSATQGSSISGLTSVTAAATSTATSGASADASTSGDTSGASTSGDASASAGTTGSPGTGGGSGFCREQCAADEDCLVGGQDDGHRCKSGRCYPNVETYAPFCLEDEICALGMFNGGFLCNNTDDCSGVYVCAAVDGYPRPGVCARPVDAMGECPSPAYIKASKPLVGGGEATLCTLDSTCKPEPGISTIMGCTVVEYCVSNDECATAGEIVGTPTCDAQHQCVCTDDAECAAIANAPHCIAGTCGCLEDRECPGTPGADTCVDGRCGCGSARTCPADKKFDGTEIVCE